MAELRAYEPTWRDNLARLLLGDGRVSPERRSMVEGLLGSSGLGVRGMGLVDLTPAGIPLAAQESRNDFEDGNYLGSALNAMAVMPAAKLPAHMAKAAAASIADDATRSTARQGIRAYHGSPHDFDKFDLSKIGTGEGAQAYGHGLYFAEKEGTARSYRDALAGRGAVIGGKPVNAFLQSEDAIKIWDKEARAAGISNEVRAAVAQKLDSGLGGASILDDLTVDFYGQNYDEVARILQGNKGRMYEVNIKADPEKFLDWDKPLTQQPPIVQDLARNADLSHLQPGNRTRRQIEMWRDGKLPNPESEPTGNVLHSALTDYGMNSRDNAALTDRFKQAGIPGIKYLDQGSRAAGDGSRNYVVFDDKLVEILRKYGLASLLGIGALGSGQDAEASPAEKLLDIR